MDVTSLFSFDVFVYNLLLLPKRLAARLKGRRAIKELKKNNDLLNQKHGKTLYICGNGPSLNLVDFSLIKDDYLVLNDFYRFKNIDNNHPPKYYMVMDDVFLKEDFRQRYEGIFSFPFKTNYIINGTMMDRVRNDYPHLQDRVFFICPWGDLFNHKKKFSIKKVHSRTWNVVCEAILFAIEAGYTEIKLLGCDYSVFTNNQHFYENIQKHPNLQKSLYKYCFTTKVHYEIALYAKKMGVSIINSTKGSLLDAYQFDSFEDK